jgi:hypothetical protein
LEATDCEGALFADEDGVERFYRWMGKVDGVVGITAEVVDPFGEIPGEVESAAVEGDHGCCGDGKRHSSG